MSDEKSIDFLRKKYDLVPKRKQRKNPKKSWRILIIVSLLFIFSGFFASYNLFSASNSYQGESFTLFDPIRKLINSENGPLSGSEQDRINILILGNAGTGHDGPELTDTIIIASIKPSTKEVAMLSIPRDLTVPMPNRGWRKINHANPYGELIKSGYGPEYATEIISDIFDIDIHYHIKVDFKGFEQLIDAIGGIEIYVDRTFTDNMYPDENDSYQSLTFEEGWQHMNGSRALKYTRSRHGNAGEGSDFARAARQQKVITASKEKILSTATILNPNRLNQLIQVFNKNVQTNISIPDIIRLAQYLPEISNNNIKNHVLDDSPNGPLYPSNLNGAYVLLPKKDNWSDLRYLAANIFADEINFSTARSLRTPSREIKLSIQNGTSISGLANDAANIFLSSGFNVESINNAESNNYEKTIIIDLTEGAKSSELAILKDFLQAEVHQSISGWLNSPEVIPSNISLENDFIENSEDIDFLIILGQNAQTVIMR